MKNILIVPLLLIIFISRSNGEIILKDDFTNENEWTYIADNVMGGISDGGVEFNLVDSNVYALLSGNVSTENNGGFIQFRMKMSKSLPEEARGLRLIVRGNTQRYFVHLRTGGTFLPWQYYQLGFDVSKGWAEVLLPFKDFKASGAFLKNTPSPEDLQSVGIVAFGRDHEAEVDVREVSYF